MHIKLNSKSCQVFSAKVSRSVKTDGIFSLVINMLGYSEPAEPEEVHAVLIECGGS